jgi:hypothetical protein
MVFKKAKISAKGVRALATQAYSPIHFKVKL